MRRSSHVTWTRLLLCDLNVMGHNLWLRFLMIALTRLWKPNQNAVTQRDILMGNFTVQTLLLQHCDQMLWCKVCLLLYCLIKSSLVSFGDDVTTAENISAPSDSHEPLLSCHAAWCVFSSTVRTISGWFSSTAVHSPALDSSVSRTTTYKTNYMSVKKGPMWLVNKITSVWESWSHEFLMILLCLDLTEPLTTSPCCWLAGCDHSDVDSLLRQQLVIISWWVSRK